VCDCCGKTYTNTDYLKVHQRTNKNCIIIQLLSNENVNVKDPRIELKYKKLVEDKKETN